MDSQQVRPTRDRALSAAQHGVAYGLSWAAPLVAPDKRFVLFGTGRVGSELLMSLLDSHRDIACDGEILADDTLLFPRRLVEWRAVRAGRRGARAYGFKVLTNQLRFRAHLPDVESFFADMRDRGHVVVLVQRRNILKVAVSFLQAESVGWHHRSSDSAPPAEGRQFLLDPMRLVAGVQQLSEATRWNDQLLADVPHLTVTYEDDLEDADRHQATVDMITDALGLPTQPVATDLVRVVPRRLRDRVANYDEIADLLARTRFAPFLDDEPAVGAN